MTQCLTTWFDRYNLSHSEMEEFTSEDTAFASK